jgi:hypothetical protein
VKRRWRIVALAVAASGCTSTLALESYAPEVTSSDAGPEAASSDGNVAEPDAAGDARRDAEPFANLPILRLPARGGAPAAMPFVLPLDPSVPRLVGPATGDTWPCDETVTADSSVSVSAYDFVLVNDEDTDKTVLLAVAGPAYAADTIHRRDVALAVYMRNDLPTDRRRCTGVMAVDCSTCGDTATAPVALARLPTFVVRAKTRYPASVFALTPGKYGQLALAAAVAP